MKLKCKQQDSHKREFITNFKFPLLVFLFILIGFFTVSCSFDKKYKVGFLFPSIMRQRFVKEGEAFARRTKELGGEAIVQGANDDEMLQLEEGYKMLEEGVSVLVICPINNNTIAPLVRAAEEKGVKVMAYIRIINNVSYSSLSTTDNKYMASLWCSDALTVSPKGNYVIIGGDRFDQNAVEEMQGIEAYLKPQIDNGNIKIVFKAYTDGWDKSLAEYNVQQVVDVYGKNINAIITCNDQMADGAITVLKKIGLAGIVPVYGQDADSCAINNITNGYQRFTLYHPSKELGEHTADLAFKLFKNEKLDNITSYKIFNGVDSIPTMRTQPRKISKGNLEDLIKVGLYTNKQIR